MKRTLICLALLLCSGRAAFAAKHPVPGKTLGAAAQSGSACGTGVSHCVNLSWTASTTAGVTYNIYRGTASGAESATPLNASPITGLTYSDPIVLTSNPQTFYYYVEAVETSSGVTANSIPSNEVSAAFPGTPAPPTNLTKTQQ